MLYKQHVAVPNEDDRVAVRYCRMSKWKWIVAGRRAVLAVRRLLRRDVGSWQPR
jgi:hypothetical protein